MSRPTEMNTQQACINRSSLVSEGSPTTASREGIDVLYQQTQLKARGDRPGPEETSLRPSEASKNRQGLV